jgi:hypothetical protein
MVVLEADHVETTESRLLHLLLYIKLNGAPGGDTKERPFEWYMSRRWTMSIGAAVAGEEQYMLPSQ